MEHGIRREAARLGDPTALLARYCPGPGRTARVVLHPRLTFIPCEPGDAEGLRATFEVDAPLRVLTAADFEADGDAQASTRARAAAYDETVAGIERMQREWETARAGVHAAERTAQDAHEHLDRVATQRAQAEAAITTATERLALLEAAGDSEADLRRALHTAQADMTAAAAELADAQRASDTASPDLRLAESTLHAAQRALAAIEAEVEPDSPEQELEAASYQLRLWAAQRAAAIAREDVTRIQRKAAIESGDADRVAGAEARLAEARAAAERAERALSDRAYRGVPTDPEAEATALRTQIEHVRSALQAAAGQRRDERDKAERALERARVDALAAERQLFVALERVEPDAHDADAVLARLRSRMAHLSSTVDGEVDELDGSPAAALRRVFAGLATRDPKEIVLIVGPWEPAPVGLVDTMLEVAAQKRVVYATADADLLTAARAVDPQHAAVRTPLDTGGPISQALARPDGIRS